VTIPPAGGYLGQRVREAAGRAAWNITDLWIAAFAIGGTLSVAELAGVLSGTSALTAAQYDLLAMALNDHFDVTGRPLIPYADQVTDPQTSGHHPL
jgi:hypothetical protein